ncbi:HAD family hydrolase [Haloarcula amylovorans]|uniref:HAD family hydrolase n=1 Tax=Haloarcula amylovorans TaxID=2562280 RepID=UPI0010768E44|nr:HAD family hydrolase [Halomicroarcula amylolytica]
MTYDALVLDSDGVLVEPPRPATFVEVARTALDDTGVTAEPTTVARDVAAGRLEDIAKRCRDAGVDLASFCQRAATTAFATQRRELEAGCRAVYDDIRALWDLDLPLGVVSDNQPQFVQHLLRYCGLDELVGTVRCRSFAPRTLERRKPDPTNLGAALSDLDAETAAYVGDRAVDVETADRLGIDSVLIEREGAGPVEASPDYRIGTLRGLSTLVG